MAEETEHVTDITDADFESKVMKSDTPAVVDCWAVWCGPCRILSPILDELAGEYAGKINVFKLDVDTNPVVSQKYRIMSIPTVLYVKDGAVSHQTVGALPKPALKEAFEKLLG